LKLAQRNEWNRHDIRGCLTVYWHSPDLVSLANNEETQGFAALQKELLTAFADPNIMGHMDLDSLKIQVVSDDSACCVARYVVKTRHYLYYCDDTSTLKRFPEGWKIVFERTNLVTH
jgi:hypothetical protein